MVSFFFFTALSKHVCSYGFKIERMEDISSCGFKIERMEVMTVSVCCIEVVCFVEFLLAIVCMGGLFCFYITCCSVEVRLPIEIIEFFG